MLSELQTLIPPSPFGETFDVNSAAEHFHECTKLHRATERSQGKNVAPWLFNPHYIARAAAGFTEYPAYPMLALPPASAPDVTFAAVLAARKSSRGLTGSLSLATLSALLNTALAVNRRQQSQVAPHVQLDFRAYPSAGNLNALETYLFLQNVEGVKPCVAHYNPRQHQLRILRPMPEDGFSHFIPEVAREKYQPPVVIVLAMLPQRLTNKYGARGYRFALLEAGHASQNISLTAQALALGSLVNGAWYDDDLAHFLGLDGVTETLASCILIGESE